MTRPPVITLSKTWSAAGDCGGAPATAAGVDVPGPSRTLVTPGPLAFGSLLSASAFAAPNPSATRSFRRSGDDGPAVTARGLAGGHSGRGARRDRRVHRVRRPPPRPAPRRWQRRGADIRGGRPPLARTRRSLRALRPQGS